MTRFFPALFYTVLQQGLCSLLRPVVSAVPLFPQRIFIVPLCPHADTSERLARSILSIVPLCPQRISIVPFCRHADTLERLILTILSIVSLCLQRKFIVPLCAHTKILKRPLCSVISMFGWSRFLQQYSNLYAYIGTYLNSLYVS